MASSITDSATNLGRKLVNRIETVEGDDWREAKRRARNAVRSVRDDYRYFTGSSGPSKSAKRSPAKRSPARSSR